MAIKLCTLHGCKTVNLRLVHLLLYYYLCTSPRTGFCHLVILILKL
jgi:hypothetical protein